MELLVLAHHTCYDEYVQCMFKCANGFYQRHFTMTHVFHFKWYGLDPLKINHELGMGNVYLGPFSVSCWSNLSCDWPIGFQRQRVIDWNYPNGRDLKNWFWKLHSFLSRRYYIDIRIGPCLVMYLTCELLLYIEHTLDIVNTHRSYSICREVSELKMLRVIHSIFLNFKYDRPDMRVVLSIPILIYLVRFHDRCPPQMNPGDVRQSEICEGPSLLRITHWPLGYAINLSYSISNDSHCQYIFLWNRAVQVVFWFHPATRHYPSRCAFVAIWHH